MAIHQEEFTYHGADGVPLFCYRWRPDDIVWGALQIAHGMGEHALRYLEPLTPLIESGMIVYASDHRGHGRTAKSKDALGDFGPRGFPALVDDMAILSRFIKDENPEMKLVLLGHSMGSFALQAYLPLHSDLIDGAILSGSAATDLLAAHMSQRASLDSIGGGGPQRTPFDWLSRDEKEVDKYIADPLCGFTVNDASRASMFGAAIPASQPEALKNIRPDLPIYLLAGDRDPINNNLEFLKPLAERYRAAGVKDVSTDFYHEGRHEMLNELNRDEVVNNIQKWINRVLA